LDVQNISLVMEILQQTHIMDYQWLINQKKNY
jgi:hypothetical protein